MVVSEAGDSMRGGRGSGRGCSLSRAKSPFVIQERHAASKTIRSALARGLAFFQAAWQKVFPQAGKAVNEERLAHGRERPPFPFGPA